MTSAFTTGEVTLVNGASLMKRTRYNPERKAWKGISYKKGKRIATLRIKARDYDA